MKNLIRIMGLAVMFLTAGQVHAGFINGSFESTPVAAGTFTNYLGGSNIGGWTIVGVDSAIVNSAVQSGITFQAQDGNNWIDLAGVNSNSPTSGVTQSVSTMIGGAYELSFYVGSSTDNVYFFASTVNLSIDGGTLTSFTNTTTPNNMLDWKKFTVAFIAQNSNTSFTFTNGSASSNYQSGLDNVSLTSVAVPEPFSITIWGIGAIGMGLVARRRAKKAASV